MAPWNFNRLGLRSRSKPSTSAKSYLSSRQRTRSIEQFEQRMLLAISPTLVAIIPNDGDVLSAGETRDTAPSELTIRFDVGQTIDPLTAYNPATKTSGIQLVRNGSATPIVPGYVGVGDNPNEIIVRFADALPDDFYQLTILGTGPNAIKNTDGQAFNNGKDLTTPFRLDLGAQVLAVVPQPVTRVGNDLVQAKDQIVVYFNNDKLDPASAQDPKLYQLIFAGDPNTNADDKVYVPTTATYLKSDNSVTLKFPSNLDTLGSGPGSYRLRIGDDTIKASTPSTPPSANAPIIVNLSGDAGSSISTATPLGELTDRSQVLKGGAILNDLANNSYGLTLPGSMNDPGHRDIPAEAHLYGSADHTVGITTIFYNFKSEYGVDPQDNQLYNLITEEQKQRAREIFELYGNYLGVKFVETPSAGLTIVTGDLRAVNKYVITGPGGVAGIAEFRGDLFNGRAVMDAAENWGDSEFGGSWFRVAMHEIGHLLGLGHDYDLPAGTVMGSEGETAVVPSEPVFPGDADIVHGQYLFRPESRDVDFYRFQLKSTGKLTAETIAERLSTSSLLDTVISIYDATGHLVARNDDYFSSDSYLNLVLNPGTYYIGVSSTGNTNFDPTIADSGYGGTTDGNYTLRLNFDPTPSGSVLVDATQTKFDGDYDGAPGGEYNFWFTVASNTIFVDKASKDNTTNGTIDFPYKTVSAALAAAAALRVSQPNSVVVVRVVGNEGADGIANGNADKLAYEIGYNQLNTILSDGAAMDVPQGVTVMIDAGAVFKLRQANINAGSYAQNIDLGRGALQVLGTPNQKVLFTSYNNQAIGVDTNPLVTTPAPGDWGGLVFRGANSEVTSQQTILNGASDREDQGIFVNYVGQAEISYGGGTVVVNSQADVYNPIHMVTSRPTIAFNTILNSASAAVSADPDSFAETLFREDWSTSEYSRVGPEIHGNTLANNSINGLFVRIRTEAGVPVDVLHVQARFNDTDIVHVIAENLLVLGTPGGPTEDQNGRKARLDARLAIDPGTIVKLSGSRIEVGMGAQLIAEGTASDRVIFTSLADDRFGAGGTFDTTNDVNDVPTSTPAAGDWGGIFFNPVSKGSLDNVLVTFAGGITPIEGTFANFNAIEIRQAEVRLANSILENNADGFGDNSFSDRNGRGYNVAATIFVRGAQPVIVNNIIRDNLGDAINVNANAMSTRQLGDYGRSTGFIDAFGSFDDNLGPLVRLNRLVDNDINGLVVRGATLTTQTAWDDVDIVHVLRQPISVPNLHEFGGLRLQSSPTQSLVVKLSGPLAGFSADGQPLDITDRIGGTLQVLGTPGHPVVLTSLKDETVGAGFNLEGQPQTKTQRASGTPNPGDWGGIALNQYSNDRNVDVTNELESGYTGSIDVNATPGTAQFLGTLAANQMNGDENRRLGFEVHGVVSYDRTSDLDVYSFNGTAGTEVWFDLDRTSVSLDSVIELVDSNGNVLARSNDSTAETANPNLFANNPSGNIARIMQRSEFSSYDLYTTNPKDAGMRLVLPGTAGTTNTYYVRVRSNAVNLTNLNGGLSSGSYQLQIRLQETDEFPGSTVRFADIRYATAGISVQGLPAHSPQSGDQTRVSSLTNISITNAQDLGNLLSSDRNAISLASVMATPLDVQWYKFTLDYQDIQQIANFSDAGLTWATIFDIDYADGVSRPDLTLSVFDELGNLILVSRDSDQAADTPNQTGSSSATDITRGSFGKLDPFIGTVQMPEGTAKTYYVAISSDIQLPAVLDGTFNNAATNKLVKLEPVTSVRRIVDDHIGFSGTPTSNVNGVVPNPPAPILPINDPLKLRANVVPFTLADVGLFVMHNQNYLNQMKIVNPITGATTYDYGRTVLPDGSDLFNIEDITIRSDGLFFGTQEVIPDGGTDNNTAGRLLQIDPTNGDSFIVGPDNLPTVPFNEQTGYTPTQGDQIISNRVTALAYQRLNLEGIVETVPGRANSAGDRYLLYYAVEDALNGGSRLFWANAGNGEANSSSQGGYGPIGSFGVNAPAVSQNGAIYNNTPGDIGDVTGLAIVNRIGMQLAAVPPSQILDGQFFSFTDATKTVVFEFDKANNGVAAGRTPISLNGLTTSGQVLTAIQNAIISQGLTVTFVPATFFSGVYVIGAYGADAGNSTLFISELPNNGDTLYGVDTFGQFFALDAQFGTTSGFTPGLAYNVVQLNPSSPFQGLTAGPPNVDINGDGVGGDLQTTVFAICANGDLYAIDTTSMSFRTDVFPNGADHISTGLQGARGLAFTPLDFNLWHPTTQLATAAGHGVNPSFDDTRDFMPEEQRIGGASYYFGMEFSAAGDGVNSYIAYPQQGPYGFHQDPTQYGVLNFNQQSDLTRNNDRNGPGTSLQFPLPNLLQSNTTLRDNTVIGNNYNFAGGARGALVTNSFSLEGYDYTDKPTLYYNYFLEDANSLEVSANATDVAKVYISKDNGTTWELVSSNLNRDKFTDLPKYASASSNNGRNNPYLQQVQEMFDTVKDSTGVLDTTWRQVRIDIGMYAGQANLKLKFEFSTGVASNNYKGFYIDDLIVGFAGRGEMVTQSNPLTSLPAGQTTPADVPFFITPQDPTNPVSQVLSGLFQLEIRRGTEYATPDQIYQQFDINDRLLQGFTLVAPSGANIVDGNTFTVSDGVYTLTFEFNSVGGVTSGNVPVPFTPGSTPASVANAMKLAINSKFGSLFNITASTPAATSNRVDLSGAARVSTAIAGLSILKYDRLGDQNIPRDQGEVILQDNKILGSLTFGIVVDSAARDPGPHIGGVRNLINVNNPMLVPGVVIANNLIAFGGQGGISFSGDANLSVDPLNPGASFGAVPFGRIVNNTIYGAPGTPNGTGILVSNNAAPTMLNNILANLDTGILITDLNSARLTVVGGSLYQGNKDKKNLIGAVNGESFGISLEVTDLLFVNPLTGNFNLLPKSKAIDSALNSLQDRQEMITINAPIGIGPSPILAPLGDLNGKFRVDDPNVLPPPGLGANVFKDRGAFDRSDFTGPKAVLFNPEDNDTQGIDQDPGVNRVLPAGTVLHDFEIQLVDAAGIGIDPSTVTTAKFILKRNTTNPPTTTTLVNGVDYIFGYDQTNQIVRFTPVTGIWLSGFTYSISLDNTAATGIKDLAANPIQPNELTGVTQFTIQISPLDFGDAPDPLYPTLLTSGGARHVIVPGVFLGSGVTEDTDGRPNENATGDVDDGVSFSTPGSAGVLPILGVPGIQSSVTITASAPGFIDAFVDLNHDGDWDDAGEKFLNKVAVVAGQNQLKFTLPAATAVDTFARFRYSTTGGLGPNGVATSGEVEDYAVTIPASVSYTVQLFNPLTNKEFIKDKQGRYVVLPNSQIEARVYVDDTRNISSAGGVFGAFADLLSSQEYVQWNAASLDVDDAFPTGQAGTADANFGVDEAGGISNVIAPVGADLKQHLFTIRGSILPTASMGTTFSITLDQADQLPAHNSLVYGLNGAVAATYQTLTVVVPASAWQNPYEPLDVFPDGYISGLDALLIINELNRPGGPLPLDPTPDAPNVPPPYLDVDGDGLVTATDVLLVINELNHPKLPSPFPVPSEAVLVSAVPSSAAPSAAVPQAAPAASAPVASAPVEALVASTSIDVMSAVPAPAAASAVPKLTDLALTVYDNLGESLLAIDSADVTAANRSDLVGEVVRELAASAPVAQIADRSASVARKLLDSSDGALAGLAQFFAAHADDDSLLDLGRSALAQARSESVGLLAKRRRGG